MKLRVKQTGSRQELTIGSQKEFLRLWNSGVIAADDLVQRGEGWVRAATCPGSTACSSTASAMDAASSGSRWR